MKNRRKEDMGRLLKKQVKSLAKIRKQWRLLGTVYTHNRKKWYFMKLYNVLPKTIKKAAKIAKEQGFVGKSYSHKYGGYGMSSIRSSYILRVSFS